MRAQCCICADLFENSKSGTIAATPCGHVFHEDCVMRWMDTSSTCPSCRAQIRKKQLITRLFFDISEDVDGEEDVSHIKNELSDLKAQVKEKTSKLQDAEESREKYQALLAVAEAKQKEDSVLINLLKADYKRVSKDNQVYLAKVEELERTEKKLRKLQHLELILSGSSSDVEEMLKQFVDGGESAITELSSLVTVMKREYNQVLSDKRAAKEQIGKLRRDVTLLKIKVMETKKEREELRSKLEARDQSFTEPMARQHHLQTSEEDQENKVSLMSPPPPKKTCLVTATEEAENPPQPRHQNNRQKHRQTAVKIPTEAVISQEMKDDEPVIPPAMMSILYTKKFGGSNCHSHHQAGSVITRGYDGFGGSTNFVHSHDLPRGSFLKRTLQKKKSSSTGLRKNPNIQRPTLARSQQRIEDCMNSVVSSLTETLHNPAALSSSSSSGSSSSTSCVQSSSSSGFVPSTSSSSLQLKELKKNPLPPSSSLSKKDSKSSMLSLSSSPDVIPSTPSSSSLQMKKLNKNSLSSSLALCKKDSKSSMSSSKRLPSKMGMFASKGPSLSGKSGSMQQEDFIDLT